jgi:hypothetical protein
MLIDFDHDMIAADGDDRWISHSNVVDGSFTEKKTDDKGKTTIGKTYKLKTNEPIKWIRFLTNPYGKKFTYVKLSFTVDKFEELLNDSKTYSYTELFSHYKTATVC